MHTSFIVRWSDSIEGNEMEPLGWQQEQVADLIVRGLTVSEMADRLGSTKRTVRTYVVKLYARAEVHPRRGFNPRVEFTLWYTRVYSPENPQIAIWLNGTSSSEKLTRLGPDVDAVAVGLTKGNSSSRMASAQSCSARTVECRIGKIRHLAGGNLSREQLAVWVDRIYLPWRQHHDEKEFRSLNRRQREVAQLLTDGVSRSEIARRLGIKLSTVMTYIDALYARSGAHNPVQFARWYITVYLVETSQASNGIVVDQVPDEPVWLKDMTHREDLTLLGPDSEKVAELLAQGLDNTRIAAGLGRSHSTVKAHLAKIRQLAGGERSRQRLAVWIDEIYLPWRIGNRSDR